MASLQSHLLIATGELSDPFTHSVVLLVRHNEDGALGLILNRRTNATLQEAWTRLSQLPCHREESIFLGGPCEGPLVALHGDELLSEIEVMPGVYFCAGKEKLESLAAQQHGEQAKFFAGYSGWSAGQLEEEIARGSWSVMPADPAHVFKYEDELWAEASRHISNTAWQTMLKMKSPPADPTMN